MLTTNFLPRMESTPNIYGKLNFSMQSEVVFRNPRRWEQPKAVCSKTGPLRPKLLLNEVPWAQISETD